jgi:Na+-driven multidrug efflux pump
MAKMLLKVTRPGREGHRSPGFSSGDYPAATRAAGPMRVMLIGFWIVVMSLVWLLPNYMGLVWQLVVTVWFTLIGVGGLLVLHRIGRKSESNTKTERETGT